MNNPGLTRYLNLGTTALSTSVTAPNNISQDLDRDPVWLEGFCINLALNATAAPTAAAASEVNAFGLVNLLKEVRLWVNDTNNRAVVNSNGPALVELAQCERVPLSSETLAFTTTAVPTSGATHRISIPVWIVPPYVEDPVGSYMGIPLFVLKQDPKLEIIWEPYTSFFTLASGNFNVSCEVELYLREVRTKDQIYYPSEIVTERYPWLTAGKRQYQIPESGFLVSVLGQSLNGTARGNPQIADTDLWTVFHGDTPVLQRSVYGAFMASERDKLNQTARVSGAAGLAPVNSTFWANFAADRPDAGAFNFVSALNMNTLTGGGAKVKVEASNASATGVTRFTRRVIRSDNIAGLIGV